MAHRRPPSSSCRRAGALAQRGMVLIEALIGILIFSIGVIGITALQSASIKMSSAAEYRSVASLLANDLIGRMWASDRSTITTNFTGPSGAGYTAWLASVQAALPGVSASSNAPSVTVSTVAGGGTTPGNHYLVTITVNWRAPNEDAHNYTVTAQVQ